MNIFGKHFSMEDVGGASHVVRLLEYQPGTIFASVPKTNNMYYQAGEFVARLDNALKYFQHDAYKRHKSLWMLDSVPKLSDFLSAVKDEEKRGIVEEVLVAFEKNVLGHIDTFAKGIIHGDFNEVIDMARRVIWVYPIQVTFYSPNFSKIFWSVKPLRVTIIRCLELLVKCLKF